MHAQRHRRAAGPAPSVPSAPSGPAEPSRRLLLTALTALAGLAGVGGCGGRDRAPAPTAPATSAAAAPLLWAGRPGGLDGDSGAPSGATASGHPSLVAFTRRSGIAVRYLPELGSDEQTGAWLRGAQARGEPCGRDLVVLGDAATARAIAAGWVRPLDPAALPGLSLVVPALLRAAVDPGRRFSVPWRSAYVGLVWDTRRVGDPPAAVDDLWRRGLRGRVVLPAGWRDGLSLLAMAAGDRVDGPAPRAREALRAALGQVERRARDGHLVRTADPVGALRRGHAWAGIARSVDVQALQARFPGRFSFVVPDTGALLSTDNLVVPPGAARHDDVLRLLDHYLHPAVAAGVSLTVPGLCPVLGAGEALATLDARRAASPLLFPTEADLARCQVLTPQDGADEAGYAEAYARLTGP